MPRASTRTSPAPAVEPWQELLATGREDERLVHRDRHDGRAGRHVTIPEELNPLVAGALEHAGIETLYTHQAQAVYSAFRVLDDRDHRHRLGQVAVLPAARAAGAHR